MDKYYTPNIEDLFIGYECEIKYRDNRPGQTYHDINLYNWNYFLIDETYHCRGCSEIGAETDIELRTKHLDKEDIEKEGWKLDSRNSTGVHFVINNYEWLLRLDLKENLIVITNFKARQFHYVGKCSSINELRKIMKWTGIS